MMETGRLTEANSEFTSPPGGQLPASAGSVGLSAKEAFTLDWQDFLRWEQATSDTIDVKRVYADMAGDLVAGILLSQIVYWHLPDIYGESKLRVKKHGEFWIAKKRDDWWDEIRITKYQFDRARSRLEYRGLIETTISGFQAKKAVLIRINWPVFMAMLEEAIRKERVRQKEKRDNTNVRL